MTDQGAILLGLKPSELADLAKTGAILLGGGWALWTFQKLQKARLAEIELRRGLSEIEKTRAEREELKQRRLAQQPVLNIEMNVTHEDHESDPNEVVLNVVVTLENKGSENLNVAFDDSTLTAGRLQSNAKEAVQAKDVRRTPAIYVSAESKKAEMFEERIFRVSQKRNMVFTVPVRRAHTLFVQFRATYYRIPFDGETKQGHEGTPIQALEQVFYRLQGSTGTVEPTASAGRRSAENSQH